MLVGPWPASTIGVAEKAEIAERRSITLVVTIWFKYTLLLSLMKAVVDRRESKTYLHKHIQKLKKVVGLEMNFNVVT